ncbi:unnamed protein product [Bursaphelenchus xylophilus]|uniref:(pine wood nematode) hypothetical protein n=1 Tax=Bursaphelenchus xylophilus TaxID=6326 RepID=A0A7I8WYR8_BURXY|nr:unnamed protein product [Bursaphelenchus xylophilus]CAG9101519.1 unnamed protein product [Bursaphelenchus xylophilus]
MTYDLVDVEGAGSVKENLASNEKSTEKTVQKMQEASFDATKERGHPEWLKCFVCEKQKASHQSSAPCGFSFPRLARRLETVGCL